MLTKNDLKDKKSAVLFNRTYYYYEMDETPISIPVFDGNDSHGSTWLKIECAEGMIKKRHLNVNSDVRVLINHFILHRPINLNYTYDPQKHLHNEVDESSSPENPNKRSAERIDPQRGSDLGEINSPRLLSLSKENNDLANNLWLRMISLKTTQTQA